jgi:hypothetical protein
MRMPGIKFLLIPVLFLCFTGAAVADSISDAKEVPATAAEMQFINRVIDQVKAALPPLDGWERNLSSYLADDQGGFRQGDELMIFEYDRKFPLRLNLGFKFHRITAAEKKEAVDEKSTQELQEEMMAAAQVGDIEKMQQLQLQLNVMLQKQMEEGVFGQAARGELGSQTPAEKPTEFQVRVLVNDGGEHIGKKYDMTAPGVTHAFSIDHNKKDYVGYKYYIGGWDVSEYDRVNWNVSFPKHDKTPANHLRALVLYVNIYGDRNSVEEYVKSSLDLNGLKGVLN